MRYEPGARLLELLTVPPAAELAHRRLADFHWANGCWPSGTGREGAEMARVPKKQWPAVLAQLRLLGWVERDGRLCNPQVASVRAQAAAFMRAQRVSARLGGHSRWRRQASPPGQATANATANAAANAAANATANAAANAEPMPTLHVTVQNSTDKALPTAARCSSDDTVAAAERGTCSPEPRKMAREGEQGFRDEVEAVFESWRQGSGARELANWGGWWRNRYRENPDKARRVLAEIRGLVRERKVHHSPGAAAVDLWGRLP